jgi:lipoprotein-anchoring transpeptidase ErfK/SrfK
MKRFWFCAPAALLLGSATPPVLLDYELDSLIGPGCARSADCAALFDPIAVAAEQRQQALAAEEAKARAVAAAIEAGLKILVSLPQQTIYVFDSGELVATSPVSTGKRGHSTPVGTFPILEKKVLHRSNLYANAPMPYMQRLTYGGVALHAGAVRSYPASHGCIRLPWAFAKKLYAMTSWTTRVTITRARPASADHALALAHPSGTGEAANGAVDRGSAVRAPLTI